ncbi:phage protein [Desulfosediminicola sp.]|uniref:phage protein n=1 Tax=Desulfosediminicola sp. TaxID=2886825 RepID=UPI003AF243B0
MKRVSSSSFSVTVGDLKMMVGKATLSIEDGRKVVKDNGVPNGFVDGEVGASGELELDATAMGILAEAANSAGSWQGIEPLDIMFYAKGTKEEEKVEAFGCLLNITDLPEFDPTSDKKAITKVAFEVTDPDFIRINGIPYLEKERTEALV